MMILKMPSTYPACEALHPPHDLGTGSGSEMAEGSGKRRATGAGCEPQQVTQQVTFGLQFVNCLKGPLLHLPTAET